MREKTRIDYSKVFEEMEHGRAYRLFARLFWRAIRQKGVNLDARDTYQECALAFLSYIYENPKININDKRTYRKISKFVNNWVYKHLKQVGFRAIKRDGKVTYTQDIPFTELFNSYKRELGEDGKDD